MTKLCIIHIKITSTIHQYLQYIQMSQLFWHFQKQKHDYLITTNLSFYPQEQAWLFLAVFFKKPALNYGTKFTISSVTQHTSLKRQHCTSLHNSHFDAFFRQKSVG